MDSSSFFPPRIRNSEPKLFFFSGGSALNAICSLLKQFTTNIVYTLPVSDDGGSTAEIVRVVGGPAIGDIRSRLIRLADSSTLESRAVQQLLQFRLKNDRDQAKEDWHRILEGSDPLWTNISEPYKETIRAFLILFNTEILRQANKKFNFSNGSIGNFFFTGARLFFNSLEAAIFWFSRVASISSNTFVLPIVNTNQRLTIGVELEDGTIIHGQHQISHPSTTSVVNKHSDRHNPLSAKIVRLFYLNEDKQEISPIVNPSVIEKINEQETIVYSMGSLYTSIVPLLILEGVGEAIARKPYSKKILLLNAYLDRETFGMTAVDFIIAITRALNRNHHLSNNARDYITHLIYASRTSIPIEKELIENQFHIKVLEVPSYLSLNQKEEKNSISSDIFDIVLYAEEELCRWLEYLSLSCDDE